MPAADHLRAQFSNHTNDSCDFKPVSLSHQFGDLQEAGFVGHASLGEIVRDLAVVALARPVLGDVHQMLERGESWRITPS